MLSLFFTSTSFGKEFFKVSDLQGVEKIFDEAQYGLKVISNRHIFHSVLRRMKNETKIQRISSLLLILDLLGRSEKKSLSSFVYQKKYSDNDGKRMRAVIEYAMEKFDEPISLDVVAEKANMSKNAFCRYFKKRTNKTFFQFLIEIRIENACCITRRNFPFLRFLRFPGSRISPTSIGSSKSSRESPLPNTGLDYARTSLLITALPQRGLQNRLYLQSFPKDKV